MQRFKSIVAVVSEDSLHEVALARAVALAKANQAALTLVDHIDAAPGELARLMANQPGRRGAAIEDDVIAYHRERLARLADGARAQQVDVSEAVLQGSPFVEVIRMVLREGHDLVIKGASRDGTGIATDMPLLRKCPCPVLLLTSPETDRFSKVVAAIDPGPEPDAVRDGLDRLVLDLATGLAEQDSAAVQVVHAWYLPEEQALRHGRFATTFAGEVDDLVVQRETKAHERVATLMQDHPHISPAAIRVVKGNPSDVVSDHAEAEQADVIVMGTVGRTGVNGFFMGGTAETILTRVRCAVLAVKPEGFVSPVTLAGAG